MGVDSPAHACGLIQLGDLYIAERKFGEAEPLLRKALTISRAVPGNESSVLQCLDDLVKLHNSMSQFEEALKLCKEAMDIRRRTLGRAHLDFGRNLNVLATLYVSTGDYGQAEMLFQQALDVASSAFGQDHVDVARVKGNLCFSYHRTGRYHLAASLYEKVQKAIRDKLGEDHPAFADCLNGIASLHETMGEYGQALRLFKQSLRIRVRALRPHHPVVAQSFDNLATLYRILGNFERAIGLYREATKIWKENFGETNPDLAINLAILPPPTWGPDIMRQRRCRSASPLRSLPEFMGTSIRRLLLRWEVWRACISISANMTIAGTSKSVG